MEHGANTEPETQAEDALVDLSWKLTNQLPGGENERLEENQAENNSYDQVSIMDFDIHQEIDQENRDNNDTDMDLDEHTCNIQEDTDNKDHLEDDQRLTRTSICTIYCAHQDQDVKELSDHCPQTKISGLVGNILSKSRKDPEALEVTDDKRDLNDQQNDKKFEESRTDQATCSSFLQTCGKVKPDLTIALIGDSDTVKNESGNLLLQVEDNTLSGHNLPVSMDDEAIADEEEEFRLAPTENSTKENEAMKHEEHKDLVISKLMSRLQLKSKYQDKLTTADFLNISPSSQQQQGVRTEKELACTFLHKLLMLDYRARCIPIRNDTNEPCDIKLRKNTENLLQGRCAFNALYNKEAAIDNTGQIEDHVHPMDIQMAVFHCSDHFLRQYMVNKLSMCQYAVPLLVPNLFTQEIECPLWTFREIKKNWKSTDGSTEVTSKSLPIYKAETPMVLVFRLGSVSPSKSQLLNSLINPRHNTFFHRHCPGSTKTRILMDGVVEIAWYCPSGKSTDDFSDCVAFCNLHGDAVVNERQRDILVEMAAVNIVLLPNLDEGDKRVVVLQGLFDSPKPLIALLCEDSSAVSKVCEGKYKIGLKDRNQSDVSEELKRTIKESLVKSSCTFSLEKMSAQKSIILDEDDKDCQTGKAAALEMTNLLKGKDSSEIKREFLPCQGRLWHDWCKKNKDLYRLKENSFNCQPGNLEMQKSNIEQEMEDIRKKQHASACIELMGIFVNKLHSLSDKEKTYFLKWVGILLDDCSSGKLSDLNFKYNERWSEVLALKKRHDKSEQLTKKQAQLENISEKLSEATFGLEHILREMGQMYEAGASLSKCIKRKTKDLPNLPKLAADLMISGHPMELMDGDAAHVPLTWITQVLDEVIKKLGDKQIFVLSVLGIQSTGKSTMLNAMFGLQFAVSAGRCTRGAFMQLVKVTEEMKADFRFDYVLVIDTEGLRALELAGRATVNHDNELATFVIGLGNMTLINIFGENPSEMQDIIQIAVQAFMRMKQVRLTPGCVFVHQNVGDITAGEKNMEGKRRLQDKLDEMTQLAAKEEKCNAECFNDVIAFDIQKDVKYFAQLWEGSPPMAPPNPCYSENVQELRNTILSKASKSGGMRLSQFKSSIQDLWNALLNENFVFSFKNTQEIALYRQLETEYGKWTFSLRLAMVDIENTLHNRIENEKLHSVDENHLKAEMKQTKGEVDKSMKRYFDESRDKEILIQWRGKFECKVNELHNDIVKGAQRKLEELIQQKEARKRLDKRKTEYESKLLKKSKELAFELQHKSSDEEELQREFNNEWSAWVQELTHDVPSINDIHIWKDVKCILTDIHEDSLVNEQMDRRNYSKICSLGDYCHYVMLNKQQKPNHTGPQGAQINKQIKEKTLTGYLANKLFSIPAMLIPSRLSKNKSQLEDVNALTSHDQESIRCLIQDITKHIESITKEKQIEKFGYKDSYIQEISGYVMQRVLEYECNCPRYVFKKEFSVDLLLYVFELAERTFTKLHSRFRKANQASHYLEEKRPEYYSIFKGYCQGATSTAVLGNLICSKLEPSIVQSVYHKVSIVLAGEIKANLPAFHGCRSNMEKHILTSLAEEEDFDKFMTYIHYPRRHFKRFITEAVDRYIHTEDNARLLDMIKDNIKHKEECVKLAAHSATEEVRNNTGDTTMWLQKFSDKLSDVLTFTERDVCSVSYDDINDFDFLKKVVTNGLSNIIEQLYKGFSELSLLKMEHFRERPDEILIKHFCSCCWVQCPFCKAVCTNTLAEHDSVDHSVPFHRPYGINGWHKRGRKDICIHFCTTSVASDDRFYPHHDSKESIPYKTYRTGGPKYADWSISPDLSQLPYWKWFMCRFRSNLEKYYGKKFQGTGKIPDGWWLYTKEQAIASLENHM